MAFNQGVVVKCKRCGKESPANEFSLDPVYKMMVCRRCVEERRMKANPVMPRKFEMPEGVPQPKRGPEPPVVRNEPMKVQGKPAPKPMPERPAMRNEPRQMPKADLTHSPDKTKQTCKKCGYKFLFDAEKGYPRNCPHCGTPITAGKYDFF
ncbi:hypothetical protein KY359_03980 [Candidatus Woesearchaeota archaeon]|nr:hypothetical protein [Candidatus Woesearchaeota archaeon]